MDVTIRPCVNQWKTVSKLPRYITALHTRQTMWSTFTKYSPRPARQTGISIVYLVRAWLSNTVQCRYKSVMLCHYATSYPSKKLLHKLYLQRSKPCKRLRHWRAEYQIFTTIQYNYTIMKPCIILLHWNPAQP